MNRLKYGTGTIETGLDALAGMTALQTPPAASPDPAGIVTAALKAATPGLAAVVKPGADVCIVVSDHTRPTGSETYIPILLGELAALGAGPITLVVALGLHRPSTPAEIERLCGGKLPPGVRVVNHDADGDLVRVGSARFNRVAFEAATLIVTGAVTFHPMAGYSGGRKSLLPGIAAASDIYRNHRLYFRDDTTHPGVGSGRTENNPVLDDILERTSDCKDVWALNVAMDEHNRIEFAACGPVDEAWRKCRDFVREHHSAPITSKYDVVVASAGGAPSDISFYQSMKVLTNASRACRPGGTLIIASECTAGWEIRNELFRYFSLDVHEVARDLLRSFTMDGLAIYIALSIIRAFSVHIFSSLPDEEVRSAGMQPVSSAQAIGRIAASFSPDGSATAVMPSGSLLLPVYEGDE